MYRIDVECQGCEAVHEVRVDASGFASGVRMQCPECERSHPHEPASELRAPDDPSNVEKALGEVPEAEQAAQSAAYGER